MAVNGITAFQPSSSTSETKLAGKSTLDMNDFFKLLTAQLSNQDMSNPVKDTEFIGQMAQFSMVQALADLNKMSSTAYSVGLIGKEATIASIDDNGVMQTIKGIVEGVTLYNGKSEVIVDGVNHPISSVMEVKTPKIIIPDSTDGINITDATSEASGNV